MSFYARKGGRKDACNGTAIRKVIMEYEKSGKIEVAAMKAGMTRKTASKYIHEEWPLEPKRERGWQTRETPLRRIGWKWKSI